MAAILEKEVMAFQFENWDDGSRFGLSMRESPEDLPLTIVLNPRCLVCLETIEYSHDFQGGDWPLGDCLAFRGREEIGRLKDAIGVFSEGRNPARLNSRIQRKLQTIRVWIGEGFLTSSQKAYADNLHLKFVFR